MLGYVTPLTGLLCSTRPTIKLFVVCLFCFPALGAPHTQGEMSLYIKIRVTRIPEKPCSSKMLPVKTSKLLNFQDLSFKPLFLKSLRFVGIDESLFGIIFWIIENIGGDPKKKRVFSKEMNSHHPVGLNWEEIW